MLAESLYWMALCIYHECRGEPTEGQHAVAHVIMNRAIRKMISVREIVLQPHQFSWVNDSRPDDVQNHTAFVKCLQSAMDARNQRMEGLSFQGADHYFADYIKPPVWAKDMVFIEKIGKHLFYRSYK